MIYMLHLKMEYRNSLLGFDIHGYSGHWNISQTYIIKHVR